MRRQKPVGGAFAGDASDQWVRDMLRVDHKDRHEGQGVRILRGILARVERLELAAARDHSKAELAQLRRDVGRLSAPVAPPARRRRRRRERTELIPMDYFAQALDALSAYLEAAATDAQRPACRAFRGAVGRLLDRAYAEAIKAKREKGAGRGQ